MFPSLYKLLPAIAAAIVACIPAAAQPTGRLAMHVENHMRRQSLDILLNFEATRSCLEIVMAEGGSRVRVIEDTRAGTLTRLTEKKGARSVGMIHALASTAALPSKETQPAPLEETGETRMIGGDTCRKVVSATDALTTTFWLGPDSTFVYDDVLTFLNRPGCPAAGYVYNLKKTGRLDGFPMEITVVPTANPADSTTVVFSDIVAGKVNPQAFGTQGYEMYDMR